MSYQTILFELSGGIARLTLNRPERLNSFTTEMHAEVRGALAEVRAREARVLVITGAGRGFCAGQDLTDRAVSPRKDFIFRFAAGKRLSGLNDTTGNNL